MKRKLLVLLGAGSSVEQGFPSVNTLDGEVANWAEEHARLVRSPNFYDLLWENRVAYCRGLSKEFRAIAESRIAANYERVLGDLHVLMNGALGVPYGDPLLQWITKANMFRGLGLGCDEPNVDDHARNKNFHAVLGQLNSLSVHLADRIRSNSRGFEWELEHGKNLSRFEPYRELFRLLRQHFDLGVYNLNYDTAALNAFPDAFVGFDRKTGRFLQSEVLTRSEWNFLYHVHGSVHHRIRKETHVMEDRDFGSKIVWHDDLWQTGDTEDWDDAGDLKTGNDGKRILPTSLVTGGWKLDQLLGEPFLTYYSCLTRHAYEAEAILIGGYGFGDPHINSILENVIRSKASGADRPSVLVLDWDKKRRPTAKRGADHWVGAMRRTLRVSPQSFRDPPHKAEAHWMNLPKTVTLGEFEQAIQGSHPSPVAIWNGGFLKGAGKAPQIAAWLGGDVASI